MKKWSLLAIALCAGLSAENEEAKVIEWRVEGNEQWLSFVVEPEYKEERYTLGPKLPLTPRDPWQIVSSKNAQGEETFETRYTIGNLNSQENGFSVYAEVETKVGPDGKTEKPNGGIGFVWRWTK